MAWQRPIVLMTSSATHASVNEIDGKDCLVYVSLPKFTFTSIKNSFNFSNTIAFEALRYYLNFKWFVTTLYFIYFKLFSYSCLYLILGDSKFLRGTSYTFVPSFLFLSFFYNKCKPRIQQEIFYLFSTNNFSYLLSTRLGAPNEIKILRCSHIRLFLSYFSFKYLKYL